MTAPVTHIQAMTPIRRERVLPISGRVLVRSGQRVAATDVIAETNLAGQHMVLDITRSLGLPAEEAEKHVVRKVGEEVAEGDVIAGPVGLFPRVQRAPKDGRIVAIGGGQVLLELENAPYEVRAGIPGVVRELLPDRGAVVETAGVLVQGVWGNGRLDTGVLLNLARTPDEELTPDRMDISMRGAVVAAGHLASPAVLELAAEYPLRGLILGSMTGELVAAALKLELPVLVLEGFGRLPLNPRTYGILTTSEKRETTVNACLWDRFGGERPELVIPLPAPDTLPAPYDVAQFTAGQTVRILRSPFAGIVGTLVSVRSGQVAFPSGLHAPAAMVRLENNETVTVPLVNLEVLA